MSQLCFSLKIFLATVEQLFMIGFETFNILIVVISQSANFIFKFTNTFLLILDFSITILGPFFIVIYSLLIVLHIIVARNFIFLIIIHFFLQFLNFGLQLFNRFILCTPYFIHFILAFFICTLYVVNFSLVSFYCSISQFQKNHNFLACFLRFLPLRLALLIFLFIGLTKDIFSVLKSILFVFHP